MGGAWFSHAGGGGFWAVQPSCFLDLVSDYSGFVFLFSVYSGLYLCSGQDIFLCEGIISFVSSLGVGVLVL